MNCVVTAGPTYEPLDEVRRLTNSSTGRLGTELAGFLTAQGHHVTLLLGEQATYRGECRADAVEKFTTTANLGEKLQALSQQPVDAVFHAAAVSDFAFGRIWVRAETGDLSEIKSGKFSTRQGNLLAELAASPKIIAKLRDWYPKSMLVGWKYEIEGDRAGAIALGERQLADCRSNVCVVNGKAYGPGFGLVTGTGTCLHLADTAALFSALEKLMHS